jgi:adenylylsulfate kinase-like enzyme
VSPEAVLLTGPFGSGKSSMAVEIADLLEERGVPYAAIDLDWLCWGDPGDDRDGAEHRMLLRNLTPVVANYLDAGVTRFVLARSIHESWQLDSLREALGMPLRVVRLTAPWPVIEARLRDDLTSGREDDLVEALELGPDAGAGLEDHTVDNDRDLREVAHEVAALLGWA